MKKPIIAVDIDDTLADHAEAFILWSNEKYGTGLTIDDYQDHWSKIWKIEQDETERRAVEFHDSKAHRSFAIKKDSKEVLERLSQSYDLVIVTARRQSVVQDSLEWIREYYGDIFKDVRFVPIWDKDNTLTKAAICKELGASFLIDDLLRHCEIASDEGIQALLFGDYKWNSSIELPENIVRVKNWSEIEKYFNERQLQK